MVGFSVVTDSVNTLPPELTPREIPAAQVSVIVDDEIYPSQKVSSLDVSRWLKEGRKVSTSAPNAAEWMRIFNGVEEPILAITASSKLSSSYNNALLAKKLSGKDVMVLDSLSVSIGQGLVVYRALLMSEEGFDISEAYKELEALRHRVRIYLSVGSMKFLARSGRIPRLMGSLGELLRLHPILSVEEGEIRKKGIARSNVVEDLLSLIEKPSGPVVVGKVEPLREEEELFLGLRKKGYEVYETYVCPDVAVHVGPRSFGYAFIQSK